MKVLNVYYYYYYLFYRKILRDPDPHFSTVFGFGFAQSLLINGLIDLLLVNIFCFSIDKWPMIIMALIIIATNVVYFYREGNKIKLIIEEKPKFFGSHKITIFIVLFSSLLVISWMFWGAPYARYILENC